MGASDNSLVIAQHASLFYSDSVHEVYQEIERLDSLFRDSFNCAPESSMFIATQWNTGRTLYSISIYYDQESSKELNFFRENVRKTEININ